MDFGGGDGGGHGHHGHSHGTDSGWLFGIGDDSSHKGGSKNKNGAPGHLGLGSTLALSGIGGLATGWLVKDNIASSVGSLAIGTAMPLVAMRSPKAWEVAVSAAVSGLAAYVGHQQGARRKQESWQEKVAEAPQAAAGGAR
ncbi:MAG: hypothetical protein EBX37_07675 [Alphaproteobacteria bacterium]|nr:hypothetical protein [Alphaproteobacteria bacterium]